MGRYVIYARKSSESDDRQVLSIDSQTSELRDLARRQGIEVAEVLTESRSAKAPGRPIFNELIRRIHSGDVTGVLCWKMDRLARNPYDSGVILQAQADGLLQQIITSDGTKSTDGNDRLMGTFELAIAAKYIDDLRANVKRGNRARFEQGWPNHRPPLGYLNDTVKKTVFNDEERFTLARKMWDMLLAGMRPIEIARHARVEWGLRSPRRGKMGGTLISHSAVYRIFRDRYYAGYIDLKDGRTYLGAHEPMITLDEFERAQHLLGHRVHQPKRANNNPFAGFIRCGNCGCGIVAEFHTKGGHQYVYHRCCRSKPGIRCHEPPLSKSALTGQLLEYYRRLAIPESLLAYLRARLDRLLGHRQETEGAIGRQRDTALRSLEREEQELLGLRVRQLIDDEVFQRERDALRERRLGLRKHASDDSRGTSTSEARARRLADVLDLVSGGPIIINEGTPFQLRSMLAAQQLEITLQGRRLRFIASEPLATLVRAASISNWQTYWPELWKWVTYGEVSEGLRPSDEECVRIMAEHGASW